MATRIVPGSPPLLRRLNSALVLRTIRAAGPVSRAEIAKETGLSKPTVNEVVELLLRAGYVHESVTYGELRPRRPGPRARLLSFRADLGHVLGIDIGANKILASVADLAGDILATERRRTAARGPLDAEDRLAEVRTAAGAALASVGVQRASLKAVAVGTPGVVDPVTGEVTLAPQLEGWEGIRLGRLLGRSFPCPVLVDNEVHLAVLAERWRGAAQDIDDAVYLQVGVGIGAGILIGGELYRGAGGAAGEIGYLPLVDGYQPPGLGLGPFEFSAGGNAFARLARHEDPRSQARGEFPPLVDSVHCEDGCADVERDHDGHQPDGAEAHDADEVVALYLAPDDSVVRGRQVVGEEDRRLVGHRVGERIQHSVSVRDAHEVGLGPVEARIDAGVAEERPPGALRHAARAAGRARPVRHEAHVHDALPDAYRGDGGSHLHDDPRELVAEDGPVLEARGQPMQREEVGSADGSGLDADDRIRLDLQDGIRNLLQADVSWPAQNDGLHAGCSTSTR